MYSFCRQSFLWDFRNSKNKGTMVILFAISGNWSQINLTFPLVHCAHKQKSGVRVFSSDLDESFYFVPAPENEKETNTKGTSFWRRLGKHYVLTYDWVKAWPCPGNANDGPSNPRTGRNRLRFQSTKLEHQTQDTSISRVIKTCEEWPILPVDVY